ncbi:acyl-CoA desaturase [Sinimarinibacterium sp. CAU 1509]|uniref:fatty acid desaturase family protein n=1 Tax=Sinimarinibacterium sp. CAU 1509 TaxID=2562283 RepID=UPI0010AC4851|nr:acyl-CoA desaturase [Sinimarinibacterium sp. CAU 1509]TJY62978.1 acyl-CoA desaturase [Sinimarinibacterium sp. CAU 1509]
MTHPTYLTDAQAEAFGKELDAIRDEVKASLGAKDAAYIHRMIRIQRGLEVAGRASLFAGVLPPFWLAGTAMLSVAKILENMEVGHNIMHGQWDWMKDPKIHSTSWEWDTACPADQWKHSHNYMHHTYTNVVGMDRDVGYGILRMSAHQDWRVWNLGQPVYNALLAGLFQYGVALHDVEFDRVLEGKKSWRDAWTRLKAVGRKTSRQALKDYVLFPLLAGPFFLYVFSGNVVANFVRNLWAYMIIFCGHFPDGAHTFKAEEIENEIRGRWYLRQLLGSCNIEGGKIFHIMSGNLSHQIEHHIFPDLPSNRYAEVAPRVREICERYGLPYNSGSLARQFGTTTWRVLRLSLPGGSSLEPQAVLA